MNSTASNIRRASVRIGPELLFASILKSADSISDDCSSERNIHIRVTTKQIQILICRTTFRHLPMLYAPSAARRSLALAPPIFALGSSLLLSVSGFSCTPIIDAKSSGANSQLETADGTTVAWGTTSGSGEVPLKPVLNNTTPGNVSGTTAGSSEVRNGGVLVKSAGRLDTEISFSPAKAGFSINGGTTTAVLAVNNNTPAKLGRVINLGGGTLGNNFLGYNIAQSLTTAYANVGIGDSSLVDLTTGYGDVAVGAGALASATSGNYSVAVGVEAARWATTATYVTAVGKRALYNCRTADHNTAVGGDAVFATTTGHDICGFGVDSIFSNTSGSRICAYGNNSLVKSVSADNLCAFGYDALSNCTGELNAAFGSGAGYNLTTGTRSTFIGADAGNVPGQKVDAVDSTAIGYGSYTTADHQVVVGSPTTTQTVLKGNVLISQSKGPFLQLDLAGNNGSNASPLWSGLRVTGPGTKIEGGIRFSDQLADTYGSQFSVLLNIGKGPSNETEVINVSTTGDTTFYGAIKTAAPNCSSSETWKLGSYRDGHTDVDISGVNYKLRAAPALRVGTATLIAGTAVVSDKTTATDTIVTLSYKTPGGTPGAVFVSAKTVGMGFVVKSTSATDASLIYYEAFEP
jgi:hypothetical protein